MSFYRSEAPAIARVLSGLLSDRVVAFHPRLARVLGGINEALFLQQVMYWSATLAPEREGWVWKSAADVHAETCLSWDQQKRCRARLLGLGVLEEKRARIPENRLYFRPVLEAVEALLIADLRPGDADVAPDPTPSPNGAHEPARSATGARAKAKTAIPADFAVPEPAYLWARSKGLDRATVDLETEAFIAHAHADRVVHVDWQAAWRKWMINAATRFGRRAAAPLPPTAAEAGSDPEALRRSIAVLGRDLAFLESRPNRDNLAIVNKTRLLDKARADLAALVSVVES